MDVLDLQVGIGLQDKRAVGHALVVERGVGHGREGGLELCQTLARRLRTRILLTLQRKRTVFFVDGDQRLVEATLGDGNGGALLADIAHLVQSLARDLLQGGNSIGADALVGLRMMQAKAQIAVVHDRRAAAAATVHRHHFRAAGDHQIFHARLDAGGGQAHSADARAAETVDRDAARLDVIAGVERRHAAEVAALLRDLGGCPPDHVADLFGVDLVALGDRLENGRTELLRMNLPQRALAGLADAARRTAGIDDPCFGHCSLLPQVSAQRGAMRMAPSIRTSSPLK